MSQHDFDILLQKYLAGECTPEEERQIIAWSDKTIDQATPGLPTAEQKMLEKKMWQNISRHALGRTFRVRAFFQHYAGVAATILVLLCAGGYFFVKNNNTQTLVLSEVRSSNKDLKLSESWIEVKNDEGGEEEIVSLEDGTIVTLAKNSRIRYPRHFETKNRQVQLEGEAVFNVKRDVNRPFFVYSGALVTQVLGTSFKIKSFESAKTIEVQVLTGRVSVYENEQKSPQARNGIILKPNQKITFDKESRKLVPELVEVPAIVEPPADRLEFAFEESPLAKVLEAVRRAYDVEIVVSNPALNACTFTGDISGLPLHTQLRFVCKSVNASYELRGTTVFVTGDGCAATHPEP